MDRKAALLQERSNAIGTETDGVFRLNHTAQAAPQLKVKGHIDLSALNQSTRPKKKTKEEKRKEREEKNRQAGGDARARAEGGRMRPKAKRNASHRQGTCGRECRGGPTEREKTGQCARGGTVREAANITRTRTANSRSSSGGI